MSYNVTERAMLALLLNDGFALIDVTRRGGKRQLRAAQRLAEAGVVVLRESTQAHRGATQTFGRIAGKYYGHGTEYLVRMCGPDGEALGNTAGRQAAYELLERS